MVEILTKSGVNELDKRYFIITNPTGNVVGDCGWIVYHHPIKGRILNGMIDVCEEFTGSCMDENIPVPLSDLTEISKEQYVKIAEIRNDGDDPTDFIDSILYNNRVTPNDDVEKQLKEQVSPSFDVAKIEISEQVINLKEQYNLSNLQFIEVLSMMITDLSRNQ